MPSVGKAIHTDSQLPAKHLRKTAYAGWLRGSGAFLIYTLEYLLRERRRTLREFALVNDGKREELFEFKQDNEIREVLEKNIFGVDINPASVEIARLALWLHTAKSD